MNDTIQTMIATQKATRDACLARLAEPETGRNTLITIRGMYARLGLRGRLVTSVKATANPMEATWVTERDARHIAPEVRNDAGDTGIPIHWRKALQEKVEALDHSLAILNDLPKTDKSGEEV